MARRRYQQGHVYKRGKRDPKWELQWWEDQLNLDGSIGRCRRTLTLGRVADMTWRMARAAAAEHLLPMNQGKIRPQSMLLFREFIEGYFVPNSFPILKISTQRLYRSLLNVHILPAFGEVRLCDLNNLSLQAFLVKKMKGGLGWERTNHLRHLFSRIFGRAKKWGYCPGDNPAIGLELPEKIPVREKHTLTLTQYQSLLGVLPEPTRTMFELGTLTGMRIGEILALRWQDVDFSAGEIRIEQAYCRGVFGSPKSKSSCRTLPMPRPLRETLERFQQYSRDVKESPLVFRSAIGTPLSDCNLLRRHLKPAGKRLGMAWLSWHVLRRTHVTLLQTMAGGTYKDAQAQVGHAKASTTMDIYTQPLPEFRRMAVERLAAIAANGNETGVHSFSALKLE